MFSVPNHNNKDLCEGVLFQNSYQQLALHVYLNFLVCETGIFLFLASVTASIFCSGLSKGLPFVIDGIKPALHMVKKYQDVYSIIKCR